VTRLEIRLGANNEYNPRFLCFSNHRLTLPTDTSSFSAALSAAPALCGPLAVPFLAADHRLGFTRKFCYRAIETLSKHPHNQLSQGQGNGINLCIRARAALREHGWCREAESLPRVSWLSTDCQFPNVAVAPFQFQL
jgi:hypothetical protein